MGGILAFYFGQVFPLNNNQLSEKQFLLTEKNKKPSKLIYSSVSYGLLFLLVGTFLFQLFDRLVNVFVISSTSILLYLGHSNENNRLLSNFVFVWIGDLSYTVYLVHWPLIQLCRYLSTELEFGFVGGFWAF